IVVASARSNDVSILLGNGNGSFANQTRYSAGSGPSSVAIGDFNNDTRLDIVVANARTNDVSVLLQSIGKLAYERSYASGGGSSLQYVMVVDWNNDRNLDIVLSNYGTNNLAFLGGYGNGSFKNQTILNTGVNSHPSLTAIDDFDGDGIVDIAVFNNGTKEIGLMLGCENGIFASLTSTKTSFDSNPLAMISSKFSNEKRSKIGLFTYYIVVSNFNTHTLLFILIRHGSQLCPHGRWPLVE
ncbi:unnamed protein product, partial [Adineta ricciae]